MASVLTSQETDFPRWYQDVIARAELADNGPVRGTMVIRPYGYSLWERIQREVDDRIKVAGAMNAYFPLFIPDSYLKREAQHVEGFSPELAVVTHGGGKELEEPVVVRPTSETVIGEYMAKWIQSHRDLPLLLNQWANVVRWEMRPRLFLRTSEFLWQEGHTAHASREDALAYARRIHLDVYRDFFWNVLALPVEVGLKTPRERFAGAIDSFSCEGMMGDGKALQCATSHQLGQNFSRAFDIGYLDAAQTRQHAWTTSWGSSTRMVGALIMAHGDDAGLVVPPALAPTQVVILPVKDTPEVLAAADRLEAELRAAGVRVTTDRRTDTGFGRRAVDWELKGVPVRVEIGPRDLASGNATVVRRDAGGKEALPLAGLAEGIPATLADIQSRLLSRAVERRDQRTAECGTVAEALEAAATGFARIPYAALGDGGEDALAAKAVTVRCVQRPDRTLPDSLEEDDLVAICARSY